MTAVLKFKPKHLIFGMLTRTLYIIIVIIISFIFFHLNFVYF